MEPTKFKELLLNIAVCAIACDGVVDEREIEALYKIEKDSPYFSALDLSESLEKSLEACSNDLKELSYSKNAVFGRKVIVSLVFKRPNQMLNTF